MASPTVSAALNKATFAVGETMTLTVNYNDVDRQNGTVTITVTDSQGNTSAPVNVPWVTDALTVAVSSVPSKTWNKVSDTGTVAVYTAIA